MTVDCLELKHVGIPTNMQKSMAKEAEAKVRSEAKLILSNSEGEASQRLVEAGDDLSPVSIHLRYLQSMLKIHRPVEDDMLYIVPLPLEMVKMITAKDRIMEAVKDRINKKRELTGSSSAKNMIRKRRGKMTKPSVTFGRHVLV